MMPDREFYELLLIKFKITGCVFYTNKAELVHSINSKDLIGVSEVFRVDDFLSHTIWSVKVNPETGLFDRESVVFNPHNWGNI